MHHQLFIEQTLSERLSAKPLTLHPVGGGSINNCYRITAGSKSFFCKVNSASIFPQLFQKEEAGLQTLAATGAIKTPAVVDCFESEGQQILLLEWIEPGERTEDFWTTFGRQLAALHHNSSETFGLHENNYMGSVPQSNRTHKTWAAFFAEERLHPLSKKCFERQLLSRSHLRLLERLQKSLPDFFEPGPPALLHGDLWSGNFLCDKQGQPC